MRTGTKSLLFGVHQFVWHPLSVWLAWIWLYKSLPGWRETICIIIHDWGYWGKINMDDEEGETHPELGANIAYDLFRYKGWEFAAEYYRFCLFHSRHYAKRQGHSPSLLCWADKFSITFEPRWFYLLRAWMSGELHEYRNVSAKCGFVSLTANNREWFQKIKDRQAKMGKTRDAKTMPYNEVTK